MIIISDIVLSILQKKLTNTYPHQEPVIIIISDIVLFILQKKINEYLSTSRGCHNSILFCYIFHYFREEYFKRKCLSMNDFKYLFHFKFYFIRVVFMKHLRILIPFLF